MDEDTEYLKLPLEERMVHKLWKARVSGYEEAKKLFGQVTSNLPCPCSRLRIWFSLFASMRIRINFSL
jgi:hypothetical protein